MCVYVSQSSYQQCRLTVKPELNLFSTCLFITAELQLFCPTVQTGLVPLQKARMVAFCQDTLLYR